MRDDDLEVMQELIQTIRHYNGLLQDYERRLTRLETLVYVLLAMNGLSIFLTLIH
jgi:hypothetical protein